MVWVWCDSGSIVLVYGIDAALSIDIQDGEDGVPPLLSMLSRVNMEKTGFLLSTQHYCQFSRCVKELCTCLFKR